VRRPSPRPKNGKAARPESYTQTCGPATVEAPLTELLEEVRPLARQLAVVCGRRSCSGSRPSLRTVRLLTRTGRPYSRRKVLRAWEAALDEIGIEGCGLRTLRHLFISRLEERGVNCSMQKCRSPSRAFVVDW
jgi:integrase